MNLALRILDGNGNFNHSAFVFEYSQDSTRDEDVLNAVEYEVWLSYQGFRKERQDFIPLEYQVAAAEIINTDDSSFPVVGRWGRNTGLVWY
jgi:hypothetical protein